MDIDTLLPLIGLQLPKVYAVNRVAEWLQEELKSFGIWETVAPYAIALPFVVSLAMSFFGEEDCGQVIGSGLLYGAAAVVVHHLHGRSDDEPP